MLLLRLIKSRLGQIAAGVLVVLGPLAGLGIPCNGFVYDDQPTIVYNQAIRGFTGVFSSGITFHWSSAGLNANTTDTDYFNEGGGAWQQRRDERLHYGAEDRELGECARVIYQVLDQVLTSKGQTLSQQSSALLSTSDNALNTSTSALTQLSTGLRINTAGGGAWQQRRDGRELGLCARVMYQVLDRVLTSKGQNLSQQGVAVLSQANNTLNTSTSALNQLSTGLRINTAADDAAGLAQQQRRGGRELGECARVIYRALDDVLSKRQTPLAQANVLNQLSTGLRINSAADDAAGLAQQQQGDGRLPYGAGDRELGQCAGVLNQVLDRVLTLTAQNPLAQANVLNQQNLTAAAQNPLVQANVLNQQNLTTAAQTPLAQANALNQLSTGLRINSAADDAAGLAQQQRWDERQHYGVEGRELGECARVVYQVLDQILNSNAQTLSQQGIAVLSQANSTLDAGTGALTQLSSGSRINTGDDNAGGGAWQHRRDGRELGLCARVISQVLDRALIIKSQTLSQQGSAVLSQANSALNTSSSALTQLSTGLRINTAADDAAGLALQQRRGGRELGECARVIYRALDDVLPKRQTPLTQANVLTQLSTGLRINSAADDAAGLAQQQQGDGRPHHGAEDRELGQCAGVLAQILDRVLTLTAQNPLAQANVLNQQNLTAAAQNPLVQANVLNQQNLTAAAQTPLAQANALSQLSTGLSVNSADDNAGGGAWQHRREDRDQGECARLIQRVLDDVLSGARNLPQQTTLSQANSNLNNVLSLLDQQDLSSTAQDSSGQAGGLTQLSTGLRINSADDNAGGGVLQHRRGDRELGACAGALYQVLERVLTLQARNATAQATAVLTQANTDVNNGGSALNQLSTGLRINSADDNAAGLAQQQRRDERQHYGAEDRELGECARVIYQVLDQVLTSKGQTLSQQSSALLSTSDNALNTSTSALTQLSTGLRINTAGGGAWQQRRDGRELGLCARVMYQVLDRVLTSKGQNLSQQGVAVLSQANNTLNTSTSALNQLSTGLRINSAADDAAGLAQQQQGDGRLPYGAGDRELGQCAGVLNQVLDRVLTLTAHNPLAQANAFNRLSTGLRINSADDHAAGLAQQQRRDERLHYGAWGLDLGQRARVNYQVLTSTAPNPFAPAGAVVTTSDTYNTSLSSSGLISNTTYYFQVAALNNDGAITAYTEAQGTSTLASPPSSPIFATVSANSVTASWTSPTGGSAAGYVLQASTAANFTGTVYSSATSNAALGTLTVSGLWANTTYFFQLASLNWNSIPSYAVWGGSTATLASPPTRLASDYIAVYYTSATLQWAALPLSPSSRTCEGYLLIASTVPDFSGTIISSATSNPALSTLTISGLNLANTYYFQVGSLNPDSVWNPVSLTQLSMQLSQSTAALSLGALDPNVYLSTISISSFVVTNQGSLPVTIVVWASTMTQPSSPWSLGQAPDVEMVLLQGLWSPTMPASGQFNTAITNSVTTSTALSYAGNQTGVSVPPGQSRTMWFQFWRPTTTVTNAKQAIQISAQAIYP